MLTDQARLSLLTKASESALELNKQINFLMDALDWYVEREEFDISDIAYKDVSCSITELAILPKMLALELTAWKAGIEPTLSCLGFEINVLNELAIHFSAIASFLLLKKVDVQPYNHVAVIESLRLIVRANRMLHQQKR